MQDTVTEHTVIEEVQTLEVSRSMISPTLEIEEEEEVRGGLDFSLDDDDKDEDFTDSDAEETVERIEIPPEERNPDVEKYRSMFTVFDDESDDTPEPSMTDNYTEADSPTDNYDSGDAPLDNTFENTADEKFEDDEDNEASAVDEYLDDEDDVPFEAPVRVAPPKKEEKPKAVKPDYSNYRFPPIDLLKKSPEEDWDKNFGEGAGREEETEPETTVTEVTGEETTAPEETVPPEETTLPEETTTETTVPEETTGETTAPEETTQETAAPEETTQETTAPEQTLPETTAPDATEPPAETETTEPRENGE